MVAGSRDGGMVMWVVVDDGGGGMEDMMIRSDARDG